MRLASPQLCRPIQRAAAIWSSDSSVPTRYCVCLRKLRPRIAAPRLSTLTTTYPFCASIWCQRKRDPPHASPTVGAAGPPYTYISTGCFFVLSNCGGTIRYASSIVEPSADGICRNVTGLSCSLATRCLSVSFATSQRTSRADGSSTSFETEGVLMSEYVITA